MTSVAALVIAMFIVREALVGAGGELGWAGLVLTLLVGAAADAVVWFLFVWTRFVNRR
jgi:hypothetical protein